MRDCLRILRERLTGSPDSGVRCQLWATRQKGWLTGNCLLYWCVGVWVPRRDLWVTGSACGTQDYLGQGTLAMVWRGTLLGTRRACCLQGHWVHMEWMVLALRAVCPPWDCLGLPVGSLLGVVLGTSPLRSTPDNGCSMGREQGARLGADQGVTMVWMVHWVVTVAGLVGRMGSMVVVA